MLAERVVLRGAHRVPVEPPVPRPLSRHGPRCIHPVEDATVREMPFLRLGPAAELLVNREKSGCCKRAGIPSRDRRIARSIEVSGDDLLAFGRVQEP